MSKSKTRVIYDVDGVLSNFWLTACIYYDKPFHTITNWDQQWVSENWNEIRNNKTLWKHMLVLNHPYLLKDTHAVAYLSAFPSERRMEREYWLKHNGFPNAPLMLSSDKVSILQVMKDEYDVFVDDKLSTIKRARAAGVNAVLYEPFYMRYPKKELSGIPVIKNLADL